MSPDTKYTVRWTVIVALVTVVLGGLLSGPLLSNWLSNRQGRFDVAGTYRIPPQVLESVEALYYKGEVQTAQDIRETTPQAITLDSLKNLEVRLHSSGEAELVLYGVALPAHFSVASDKVEVVADDFKGSFAKLRQAIKKKFPYVLDSQIDPGVEGITVFKRTPDPNRLTIPVENVHEDYITGKTTSNTDYQVELYLLRQ